MKILVTGGSGKAGAFVVSELAAAGHDVTNIDRVRPREPQPGGFILVNLTDARRGLRRDGAGSPR